MIEFPSVAPEEWVGIISCKKTSASGPDLDGKGVGMGENWVASHPRFGEAKHKKIRKML